MSHLTLSPEEVTQRGRELLENQLCAQVEVPENVGKLIAIDINTADYEIDTEDLLAACDRLKLRQPNALIYMARIGYNAAYAIGGTLVRTAKC